MAHEDQPDPGVTPDVVEQVQHLCLDGDVEGRHGLVQHEHPRLDGECAGDRGSLPLAAGEPSRQRVGLTVAEPDLIEQLA